MGSTIATVVMVAALLGWHLKIRRHANWHFSADARFYITAGYPLVAIAVYFLSTATSNTDWAWALGNVWALVAMVSFVYGFESLNAQRRPHHALASPAETEYLPSRDVFAPPLANTRQETDRGLR